MCTAVLKTGFVNSCTVNWFMKWECIGDKQEYHTDRTSDIIKECTGDRQEYHTDRTLHIIRNVQGTDRNITLTEHYT